MTLRALAGRWVALVLPGRRAPDAHGRTRTSAAHCLRRPDGTVVRVGPYARPDGATVVVAHGWGIDSPEWYYAERYYAERALAARFSVLVWDLRGLGQSSAPPTIDCSLDTTVADLAAVLEGAAGDGPAGLVGHSIGGIAILAFYRRFPEQLAPHGRMADLVLVNTTYTTPLATTSASGFFSAIRYPVLEPLLHLTVWLWPLVWLASWLSYLNGKAHLLSWLTGFAGRAPRSQLDFATRLGVESSPAVLARGVLAAFRYAETSSLAAMQVPALVLTGDGDRVLVPEASARMADTLPHAERASLPDARHQALLQRHQPFDEALASFADRCLTAPAARAA